MFEKRLGKKLGEGTEKMVFEDLDNPKLAIGVFREGRKESPERTKGRFYMTKILNLIFPENFPDIHLASNRPHTIIVDKVTGREFDFFDRSKKDADALLSFIKKMGGFDITIDANGENFKRDSKNDSKYVDSLNPWFLSYGGESLRVNYDAEKLENALLLLPEDKMEKGLSYLKRLEDLRKTEEKNLGIRNQDSDKEKDSVLN